MHVPTGREEAPEHGEPSLSPHGALICRIRTTCLRHVTSAPDGLKGLDALRGHAFDAVITDVHMPGRGGLWLWNEALALRPELRGKFVFMSSEPRSEEHTSALFMVKPLSLAT